MIYAYLRVSTEMQTVENQKLAIDSYLAKNGVKVDYYYNETKSGTIDYKKRQLGGLLDVINKGDILICTELSRLGRSMTMVFNIIDTLAKKEVKIIAIKNNFIFEKNDIISKVLVFAFSISAEIERDLISERTKQGLNRARKEGKQIGHFKGYKCKNVKLTPYTAEIIQILNAGGSIKVIADKYGVKWSTARDFIRDRLGYELENIESVKAFRQALEKKRT